MSDNLISKGDESPKPAIASDIEKLPPANFERETNDTGKEPTISADDKKPELQMQLAIRNHTYVTEFIKLADQKAGFLFAVCTSFLVYLYGKNYQAAFIKPLAQWMFSDFLHFVVIFSLIISSGFSFWVIRPRMKSYKTKGLIFWESVSQYDHANDYVRSVTGKSKQEIVNELFEHHFALSHTCTKKYNSLNWAILVGAIGIVLGILTMIF